MQKAGSHPRTHHCTWHIILTQHNQQQQHCDHSLLSDIKYLLINCVCTTCYVHTGEYLLALTDCAQRTFVMFNRFCPLGKNPFLHLPPALSLFLNGQNEGAWNTSQNQKKHKYIPFLHSISSFRGTSFLINICKTATISFISYCFH